MPNIQYRPNNNPHSYTPGFASVCNMSILSKLFIVQKLTSYRRSHHSPIKWSSIWCEIPWRIYYNVSKPLCHWRQCAILCSVIKVYNNCVNTLKQALLTGWVRGRNWHLLNIFKPRQSCGINNVLFQESSKLHCIIFMYRGIVSNYKYEVISSANFEMWLNGPSSILLMKIKRTGTCSTPEITFFQLEHLLQITTRCCSSLSNEEIQSNRCPLISTSHSFVSSHWSGTPSKALAKSK